ncbi:AGE family epimerase/isomerase [Mucilaginibacter dorajii]|uniref:Cellobiose 2-epimerase n=1 Tax=Mucilaginibacter dorajii TaxID=692994 RepID=A0ABP7QX31_9SPHI|nr:AGE family epimerase/isomerase [Mucilaginibacter dorajii]MCS3732437.1 mannobiose 2-epimerase [Mucilaginibacter dorajii]
MISNSAITFAAALTNYKHEVSQALDDILDFWMSETCDSVHGGFIGRIDGNNEHDATAPKGAVLNARILWTFSAAYKLRRDPRYHQTAKRAYDYMLLRFIDQEYGGVYWTVDVNGVPLDMKKQVYAIAFTIYGLSEYHQAFDEPRALELSKQLYHLLIERTFDRGRLGYFEAYQRDWKELNDLRLSPKDANEKKTMNTHLHVLEAYATLYISWPNEELRQQIRLLLEIFRDHIISPESGHLILFFDENWVAKSDTVSYGHDIEAAWLLLEAAEIIQDEQLIPEFEMIAQRLARAAAEGLAGDGSLSYEFEPSKHELISERHWWVQAEAMVGFFNAYQLSGEPGDLSLSLKSWEYTKAHIIDKERGEWFWGALEDGCIMPGEDKVGIWKCPYHNSRACLEIIKRVQNLLNS